MIPVVKSLLVDHQPDSGETVTDIATGSSFRLEHIVSHGMSSASGFWYDQDRPEWVLLMQGQSVLEFEEGSLELKAGDSLLIPAGMRHRVASASADAIWVALHLDKDE
jgi:cupin 2 domain-containing protein